MRGSRLATAVLLAAVPLGALLGVLWYWWWEPPLGIVVQDQWVLQPSGPDLAFDGTGLYVLIAVVVGIVVGVVVGYVVQDRELLVLGAVLLAAVLAGWVMYLVGHTLGPPDPARLAVGKEDLSTLPAQLGLGDGVRVAPFGSTAGLALPLGAVLGAAVSLLTSNGRRGAGHRAPSPVEQ